jgi:hypothetical protein
MSRNPSVDRFRRDMQDLSVQMAHNLHDTILLQADELIQNMANAIEHSVSGNLRASLRKKDVTQKFGDIERPSVLVIAGGPKTTRRTKGGTVFDYSLAEEFGTRNEAPRPFFYGTARLYQTNFQLDCANTLANTIAENNEMRSSRSEDNSNRSVVGRGGAISIKKGKR